MRLYLIGFMGSGKSFLGETLANQLGLPFIDLDDHISQHTQKRIDEIISDEGITKFREIESECLRSFDTSIHQVMATGGGTPCFSNNIEWMNNHGVTFYLKATPVQLYNRLASEKRDRPLIAKFNDEELLNFIEEELPKRAPFYEKAIHIIDVGDNAEELIIKYLKQEELI